MSENFSFGVSSIFSTYRQGENRVTGTLVSLLNHLPVVASNALIAGLFGDQTTGFVTISNQSVNANGDSVYDASIKTKNVLMEVKTTSDAVSNNDQLRNHQEAAKNQCERLLYLTPDVTRPEALLKHKYIGWSSFVELDAILTSFAQSNDVLIGERELFLIKNFQKMLLEDGLLGETEDTCVVAAAAAYQRYKDYGVYICQPNRSFRHVKYLAFYADGEIKKEIPTIDEIFRECVWDDENRLFLFDGKPMDLKKNQQGLERYAEKFGLKDSGAFMVMSLSNATDKENTRTLDEAIPNDLKNANGKAYAYTQGQRYCLLKDLVDAKSTSELIGQKS